MYIEKVVVFTDFGKEIWILAIAGVCSLLIAILTIGYQSLMAAYRNPVDVLKDE